MTTMSDLPWDLVVEILSRVPLTSLKTVRSTCQKWNSSSQSQIFGKTLSTTKKKQFLGFMMMDCKICSLKFDLQGIRNENDFVDPSVKQISRFNHMEIKSIIHCDGLLLCVKKDDWNLVVWNPYLGQTRKIQPRYYCERFDWYAFGYSNNNNRNHKILRVSNKFNRGQEIVEIYDFNSNSWRVLDANFNLYVTTYLVSLKGNSYFIAQEKLQDLDFAFLQCFDFTAERFGPQLSLPFLSKFSEPMIVSCVREEQLAVLYEHDELMEIWITTRIEPDTALWSKFLKLDITNHIGLPVDFMVASFFVDEEKKVVVVSDVDYPERTETSAHIIGQDGYYKSVKIGEAPDHEKHKEEGFTLYPPEFSSYVPSLVQVHIKQLGKRKKRDQ